LRPGLHPGPYWGTYSAPPDILADYEDGEGKGSDREKRKGGREKEEREEMDGGKEGEEWAPKAK